MVLTFNCPHRPNSEWYRFAHSDEEKSHEQGDSKKSICSRAFDDVGNWRGGV
jgi:hypothetical protein